MPNLDPAIDYASNIVKKLAQSQKVVALIFDDPDIDMDGSKAQSVCDTRIFDYNFVDETVKEVGAYILVEADVVKRPTGATNRYEINIYVVCHKTYMKLDPKKFKGMRGNRRDNISRCIDELLEGSREFGIGKLHLVGFDTVGAPMKMSARQLVYLTPEFAVDNNGRLVERGSA